MSHSVTFRWRASLLALSSAFLLVASFPNFNQPWCAWVALVPWLLLLHRCAPRAAFWWSYLTGLLFFLASMWWLVYVTVIGWLVLCAYLAVYFGVFGWLVHRRVVLRQGTRDRRRVSRLPPLFIIPATWTALEYARSHLLSGLGWNLLAYSQTRWLAPIQLADVTGVWGVSFMIVAVNVALADVVGSRVSARPRGSKARAAAHRSLRVAAGMLLLVLGYGFWRLHSPAQPGMVRIAVVQGNIPQEEKWDEEHQQSIIERYEAFTRQVASTTHPDLVVWPETSVPGYFGVDEALTQRVLTLAQTLKVPLLVGAPMLRLRSALFMLSNSAALVDPAGTIVSRYDKVHLVPLGEFIPFERLCPWLRHLLPPIGDFVPGNDYTVFRLNTETAVRRGQGAGDRGQGTAISPTPRAPCPVPPFSVLICFEDVFPDLARRFVQRGARALFVITNDAWFGPTAAAYQHAQASTFRAVELRVPVIRAANTGWSGCIDASGRWGGSVRDANGAELFVAGTHTCNVVPGTAQSFYRRWGDWFAWGCVALVGTLLGIGALGVQRRNRARTRRRVH